MGSSLRASYADYIDVKGDSVMAFRQLRDKIARSSL
jgi:hypothetical protein